MKKRLLSVLLALVLLVIPVSASGRDLSGHSGDLSLPKLSRQEIQALLEQSPATCSGEAMAEASSTSAPYALGKVDPDVLNAALGRFNALRRLAGLGAVTLDSVLGEKAQYGAVLLAAAGKLTHHPDKPADMPEEFYAKGHEGASSSNIYSGGNGTLLRAVDKFFDDSDRNNVADLGHRRWMLNPTMAKTGLGFSPSKHLSSSGYPYNYATLWAFDRSGTTPNYNFIAWPASGNFPTTLFQPNQAWSVTLNPEIYTVPTPENLSVLVRREADGTTWFLSGQESYTAADKGAYLKVDTTNYGVANCIIFRPGSEESYEGRYSVTINGLKSVGGTTVTLRYEVDFFDPDKAQNGSAVSPNWDDQEPQEAIHFIDVAQDAWYAEAVDFAAGKGLFNGVGGDRFDPNGTTTRAMIMTVLARLDGQDTTPQSSLESWYIRGHRWAVTYRISDGLNPGNAITLQELATMLYRYAQLRYGATAAHIYHLPEMPDGNDVSNWAQTATNWAVDNGILIGDEAGLLNPRRSATRAQVAILLQRFLNNIAQ